MHTISPFSEWLPKSNEFATTDGLIFFLGNSDKQFHQLFVHTSSSEHQLTARCSAFYNQTFASMQTTKQFITMRKIETQLHLQISNVENKLLYLFLFCAYCIAFNNHQITH